MVGCRIKSERRGTPASVECRGGESKGGRRKMIRRSGQDDDDDLGMCDGEEKKGRQWPRATLSMKSGNWGVDTAASIGIITGVGRISSFPMTSRMELPPTQA